MSDSKKPPVFSNAVSHWWASKKKNKEGIGAAQAGTRGANLAGNTMDGFRDTIIEKLLEAGVARADIFSGGQVAAIPANLPSYFRASKNWDVIVCKNSLFKKLDGDIPASAPEPRLVAAIEFKSQEGSIGNNQNNRLEESIGNASDFWASYENKNFVSLQPRPWLGYLFVGRYDEDDVKKSVEIRQPHFVTDPGFTNSDPQDRTTKVRYKGPSYAERYRIFLERMIGKKLYDGAGFIVTNEVIKDKVPNHLCPFNDLSGDRFLDLLVRHVKAYYFD